jgi:c(7)-type cytochrome triheme protein
MKGGETIMKKLIAIAIVVIVTMVFSAVAFATPAGKNVDYAGGGAGKVVFDGKTHADKGLKCADCHPGNFKMKKGTAVHTMKDMEAGKNCGACHDGKKAFEVKTPASCAKCHKK